MVVNKRTERQKRRNRPAEEQQKKKGGEKKTTGRGDGAKKRGFATQRRFALWKNAQPLGENAWADR